MEDEESLKSDAVFGKLADSFQHKVNEFFSNRVVSACIVIGRVLLAINHLLRVKQTSIWTHAYLVCKRTVMYFVITCEIIFSSAARANSELILTYLLT